MTGPRIFSTLRWKDFFGRLYAKVAARGIWRNGILSMVQTAVLMVNMFLTYRLVISHQGLGALGLWSLLVTFAGVSASFDISGASALSRSVARHDLDFQDTSRARVIHTVLLTSMVINGIFVLFFGLGAPFFLPALLPEAQVAESVGVLPLVCLLMLLLPLAVGVSSAIDGFHRADIRSIINIIAAIIALTLASFTIPVWGLWGLGIAQCVQQFVIFVGGWIVLRRLEADMGWLPVRWKGSIARRTTGFAVRLNLIGIIGLLFDPLTKLLLIKVGGTHAVGTYELAARLALQLRNLVIAATTPLIPAFAAAQPGSTAFGQLYVKTQRVAILGGGITALASIVAAPILSLLVIGSLSVEMIQENIMLAVGWGGNVMAAPLFMAAQAQGKLRWNFLGQMSIALCVIAVGALSPTYLGAPMVVAGLAVGLLVGAAVTTLGNARTLGQTASIGRLRIEMAGAWGVIVAIAASAWLLVSRLSA